MSRESRLHFRLGKKLLKEFNYKGAEKEFLNVIRFNPGHFRAHVYLARIYKQIENFTESIEELTIAFKLNPGRYRSYKLEKEHQELSRRSTGKRLSSNLSFNLRKCASNISEAARRMHIVLSKQQKFIDNLAKLDKTIADKKNKGDKPQTDDTRIEIVEKMVADIWASKEKACKKQDSGKKRLSVNPFGDFSSPEEYKKFQKMPPISREEIDELDWDELFDED